MPCQKVMPAWALIGTKVLAASQLCTVAGAIVAPAARTKAPTVIGFAPIQKAHSASTPQAGSIAGQARLTTPASTPSRTAARGVGPAWNARQRSRRTATRNTCNVPASTRGWLPAGSASTNHRPATTRPTRRSQSCVATRARIPAVATCSTSCRLATPSNPTPSMRPIPSR